MTSLEIRPLVAGEETLFDSMPDPMPRVRKIDYADGLATGGYRPERTWVAILDGRVVAHSVPKDEVVVRLDADGAPQFACTGRIRLAHIAACWARLSPHSGIWSRKVRSQWE